VIVWDWIEFVFPSTSQNLDSSMLWKNNLFAVMITLGCVSGAHAQLATGWKAHDWERPAPKVVTPGESNLPLAAPSDAIVLFDGSNLDGWCDPEGKPTKWKIVDGVMESVPGSGYVFTRQAFGDVQLHVEWSSPSKVEGRSQGRGNSGVFLMGLFEVQVLDSFENRTYADGQAAAVYGQYPPLVNASRGPGQWQSYDIIFHRAKFDARGDLTDKATITVLHNGVLVQDNTHPFGPTSWILHHEYKDIGPKAPLSLQDHGNPVRYRNIWVRELNNNPYPPPATPYDSVAFVPSSEQLDKLAGEYGRGFGRYLVVREGRTLRFKANGNDFILVPHSDVEFQLPYTAATVEFKVSEDGKVTGLTYTMGGDSNHAPRRGVDEDKPKPADEPKDEPKEESKDKEPKEEGKDKPAPAEEGKQEAKVDAEASNDSAEKPAEKANPSEQKDSDQK
jgi:hypothetical protein